MCCARSSPGSTELPPSSPHSPVNPKPFTPLEQVLSNFLSAVSALYRSVPYHNYNHVCHVLHTTWMVRGVDVGGQSWRHGRMRHGRMRSLEAEILLRRCSGSSSSTGRFFSLPWFGAASPLPPSWFYPALPALTLPSLPPLLPSPLPPPPDPADPRCPAHPRQGRPPGAAAGCTLPRPGPRRTQ